jgi:DNA-directed RNA polymerase specialized sigma24 family protein
MTREEFEQLYIRTRDKAVAVAARAVGNTEIAEDAVQEAAIYCLQRLDKQPAGIITEAFFIRATVDRAKNVVDARPERGNSIKRFEVPRGTVLELDRSLYGPDED